MATDGAWKRTGRLSGADAGRKAIRVYVCVLCGAWHEGSKPAQCIDPKCGSIAFEFFASKGEAKHWAYLEREQHFGRISDLRRQVAVPLMTVGREGLAVKFAEAILDYGWTEDGRPVLADWKPSAGISPEAALKFRCLEAQGITVRLINAKGTV